MKEAPCRSMLVLGLLAALLLGGALAAWTAAAAAPSSRSPETTAR